MDYTALFLILILTTTQTTPLHHHCNSDVYSSASGLQELTTLQYCLIDNCTIIRNDTGQQLDIVYTTQSHLVVTPTDGHTSTLLISKNDPELFCSSPDTTDDAIIQIIRAFLLLLSTLSSGYIAVLHLLFKELRTIFGKLMIIYNIATAFRTLDTFILLITHYSIAVHSVKPCYLIYFVFMQLLIVGEGSATCITGYLAYIMHQSCKYKEVTTKQNKILYKNYAKYIFGSLLLCDILIISYDFGTATFQHVILPNGHCNYFGHMEYATERIAQAYTILNKITQIVLLVLYFVYYYKLNKMLQLVRTLPVNVDHQQNQLFLKVAITMAATIGISQFFFAYIRLFTSFTNILALVGGLLLLIQQFVIIILFTSSKKVLRLFKRKFCITGTSS